MKMSFLLPHGLKLLFCHFEFFLFKKIIIIVFQNHEFPGETELPPGLRGCNQQADQPGAVCLLCLPVHGECPIKKIVMVIKIRVGKPGVHLLIALGTSHKGNCVYHL